jgi:putative membrane protein
VISERLAHWSIRTFAAAVVRRKLVVEVHGREQVPAQGPTVLVARHYHHLYDAALLLTVIDRPVHFLVALDWVGGGGQKAIMEAACRAARWPVLLRSSAPSLRGADDRSAASPYRPGQTRPYLRRALGCSNDLLRQGRLLVVFPEGYPNVDPTYTAKRGPADWLPFSPIFARIAARAERSLDRPVAVVPVGLAYRPGRRWRARLWFGPATSLDAAGGRAALTQQVESAVVQLSRAGWADSAGGGPFEPAGGGQPGQPGAGPAAEALERRTAR